MKGETYSRLQILHEVNCWGPW